MPTSFGEFLLRRGRLLCKVNVTDASHRLQKKSLFFVWREMSISWVAYYCFVSVWVFFWVREVEVQVVREMQMVREVQIRSETLWFHPYSASIP